MLKVIANGAMLIKEGPKFTSKNSARRPENSFLFQRTTCAWAATKSLNDHYAKTHLSKSRWKTALLNQEPGLTQVLASPMMVV